MAEETKNKDAETQTEQEQQTEAQAEEKETTASCNEECQEAAEPSELDKANEQVKALSDKLIRKAAEFDNFKKRTAKERDEFYKTAVCDTVTPFLAVLDNLERAVAAAEAAGETGSVLDGIKMVKKQFDDVLTEIGVSPIEAVGQQFDPEKHNAVMTAESDEEENTVIEEFQKGYTYRDKVVRHSMVKVSN